MRDSILNVDVSCFKNYSSPDNPITINLLEWLNSDKYKAKVQLIRSTQSEALKKELKAELAGITPSGIFYRRDKKSMKQPSRIMQIDIDGKDNKHIESINDLKKQLSKIPQVAYVGLSVGGNGLFVLIPIANPDNYKLHYDYAHEYFKALGIACDAACRKPEQLRGYSYDESPYFNHSATVLTRIKEPEPIKPKRSFTSYFAKSDSTLTPWQHFNQENQIFDVVSQEFEIVSQSENTIKIKRFGATSKHSGYIYENNCMYLFTDGTIYPNNELITPFKAYAFKYCNGDIKQAIKELKEQGYGV